MDKICYNLGLTLILSHNGVGSVKFSSLDTDL